MTAKLYGMDASTVQLLLEQVQEERNAIRGLADAKDPSPHDVTVDKVVYSVSTSELIAAYRSRIERLSARLSDYGIEVAEETARPKRVEPPKKPNANPTGETK